MQNTTISTCQGTCRFLHCGQNIIQRAVLGHANTLWHHMSLTSICYKGSRIYLVRRHCKGKWTLYMLLLFPFGLPCNSSKAFGSNAAATSFLFDLPLGWDPLRLAHFLSCEDQGLHDQHLLCGSQMDSL